MSIARGFLALTLTLIGAGGAANGEDAPIAYHIRFLEMDGPGWRETLYSQLRPVARRGTATVWTADRDALVPLNGRALSVVQCPQVTARSGSVAHLSMKKTRKIVTDLTRHADGPIDHATSVAYTPEYEDIREGFQATVTGRKLDQGVLARVVLDDSRIVAVHQVTLTEAVEAKGHSVEAIKAAPRMAVPIQVPEVVRGSVEGEWLIPTDEVLVMSLGTFTTADAGGKAVVRERLVLLDAKSPSGMATNGLIRTSATMAGTALRHHPAYAPTPMPTPLAPSRSLPQGTDANGTPVALPPLPAEPPVPSTLPGSSEPVASPQARPQAQERSRDDEASRTSLKFEVGLKETSDLHWASWSPVKPLSFRIPLGGESVIEIEAKIVPAQPR